MFEAAGCRYAMIAIPAMGMNGAEVDSGTDVEFLQFRHELITINARDLGIHPNNEQVPCMKVIPFG